MILTLERYSYGFKEPYRRPTEGRLFIGDHTLWSIEDPWNSNVPFDSCIPDGVYDLVPHSTPKHPDTWAMVNHSLGVYHLPDDRQKQSDRYACLIHSGNYEEDIEGCIAPGLSAAIHDNRLMVTHSRDAMTIIRDTLGVGSRGHKMLIRQFGGAHVGFD